MALTAEGERFGNINPELRQLICLTDDDVLHIVDGYEADPFVLAFQDTVRRAGIKAELASVTPEQLKELYQGITSAINLGFGRSSQESASKRQREVVQILKLATQSGASDIHFFPTPNGHQLRFRVHGELDTIKSFAGGDGLALLSTIYTSMCESVDPNYRPEVSQDGRLQSEFVKECGLFGARIATRPTLNGPWMAVRLLYDSGEVIPLERMGYLDEQIDLLTRLIHRTEGMVLLSGTTGSGKSTALQTLLSMLLKFNNFAINLATVEDPVEYRIEGANQTPLLGEWADAITNLMRMDPDVLMLGEIRDLLSAIAAFQAANTGHGAWSTVHTSTAAACIQRLHDLGVEDSLLMDPSLVKGLVNQSLTRVLCPDCKLPYLENCGRLTRDLQHRIQKRCIPEHVYLKGAGCARCKGRGVVGRTAIAEIILPDLRFMRTFREKGKAEAQAFWVHSLGGITKNAHLIHRINEGIVDPLLGEKDVCQLDEDVMTIGGRQ
ncbi:general secretion pathway protein E (plasmid) [Metapseudomonas furukawaii]|uniref:General secretion pathway protein E n=1 Tax=Metapseudomonas furukawaii TaxID=1149133 RepID=A0AAD1FI19_METFU|nr:general secretion pathway protein E [Pseudomonas furukawaii]